MNKETFINVMKELKNEGIIKEIYKTGFTIENYKDEYNEDFFIKYGEYRINSSFTCSTYVEIYQYFNSKTKLKEFVKKVIEHQQKGYCVRNLVDEINNKKYCEQYYNNYTKCKYLNTHTY